MFVLGDYHIIFAPKIVYLNQTSCLPYTSNTSNPKKLHDVSHLEMIGYASTILLTTISILDCPHGLQRVCIPKLQHSCLGARNIDI